MFSFVEIRSLTDPLLLPWLDLYETAFPPGERILVSRVLNVLHDQARGLHTGQRLLAVVGGDPAAAPAVHENPTQTGAADPLLGIIFDYEPPGGQAAFLWYFAVDPRIRGQGLGAQVYRRLLDCLDPRVRALIFDLEDPARMETPEAARLAERRIAFYRRQGARLLGGIRYIQVVGSHQPPLLLHLMVRPIQEITPREAFDLAQAELGEEILQQTGELCWD